MLKRFLSLIVIISFSFISLGPICPIAYSAEDALNLPPVGSMVSLSPAYEPTLIKGLTVHKDNPFLFDFIVDTGHSGLTSDALKKEGNRLVKYFFACLTIPEKDLWVNLSPYEKDRMVPEALGQTALGRDLLAQDYILKQLTASLIYPEKNLGREFWNRVYAKAQEMYGTSQIPVNTFNKVWIVADTASVYEHGQNVFVVGGHLKVMLEEDYLALQKHKVSYDSSATPQNDKAHSIASNIVRQIILPELEKEVNGGQNFATLRQIFNSLILATWYKKNLKDALINQIYADKAKVKGVNLSDPSVKEKIYQQYLKAYKKGVFDYIKEENQANGPSIPRKYFSGGFVSEIRFTPPAAAVVAAAFGDMAQSSLYTLKVDASINSAENPASAAMLTDGSKSVLKELNKSKIVGGADGDRRAAVQLLSMFPKFNKKDLEGILFCAQTDSYYATGKMVALYMLIQKPEWADWNVLVGFAYKDSNNPGKFPGRQKNYFLRRPALDVMADIDLEKAIPYLLASTDPDYEEHIAVRRRAVEILAKHVQDIKRSPQRGAVLKRLEALRKDDSMDQKVIAGLISDLNAAMRSLSEEIADRFPKGSRNNYAGLLADAQRMLDEYNGTLDWTQDLLPILDSPGQTKSRAREAVLIILTLRPELVGDWNVIIAHTIKPGLKRLGMEGAEEDMYIRFQALRMLVNRSFTDALPVLIATVGDTAEKFQVRSRAMKYIGKNIEETRDSPLADDVRESLKLAILEPKLREEAEDVLAQLDASAAMAVNPAVLKAWNDSFAQGSQDYRQQTIEGLMVAARALTPEPGSSQAKMRSALIAWANFLREVSEDSYNKAIEKLTIAIDGLENEQGSFYLKNMKTVFVTVLGFINEGAGPSRSDVKDALDLTTSFLEKGYKPGSPPDKTRTALNAFLKFLDSCPTEVSLPSPVVADNIKVGTDLTVPPGNITIALSEKHIGSFPLTEDGIEEIADFLSAGEINVTTAWREAKKGATHKRPTYNRLEFPDTHLTLSIEALRASQNLTNAILGAVKEKVPAENPAMIIEPGVTFDRINRDGRIILIKKSFPAFEVKKVLIRGLKRSILRADTAPDQKNWRKLLVKDGSNEIVRGLLGEEDFPKEVKPFFEMDGIYVARTQLPELLAWVNKKIREISGASVEFIMTIDEVNKEFPDEVKAYQDAQRAYVVQNKGYTGWVEGSNTVYSAPKAGNSLWMEVEQKRGILINRLVEEIPDKTEVIKTVMALRIDSGLIKGYENVLGVEPQVDDALAKLLANAAMIGTIADAVKNTIYPGLMDIARNQETSLELGNPRLLLKYFAGKHNWLKPDQKASDDELYTHIWELLQQFPPSISSKKKFQNIQYLVGVTDRIKEPLEGNYVFVDKDQQVGKVVFNAGSIYRDRFIEFKDGRRVPYPLNNPFRIYILADKASVASTTKQNLQGYFLEILKSGREITLEDKRKIREHLESLPREQLARRINEWGNAMWMMQIHNERFTSIAEIEFFLKGLPTLMGNYLIEKVKAIDGMLTGPDDSKRAALVLRNLRILFDQWKQDDPRSDRVPLSIKDGEINFVRKGKIANLDGMLNGQDAAMSFEDISELIDYQFIDKHNISKKEYSWSLSDLEDVILVTVRQKNRVGRVNLFPIKEAYKDVRQELVKHLRENDTVEEISQDDQKSDPYVFQFRITVNAKPFPDIKTSVRQGRVIQISNSVVILEYPASQILDEMPFLENFRDDAFLDTSVISQLFSVAPGDMFQRFPDAPHFMRYEIRPGKEVAYNTWLKNLRAYLDTGVLNGPLVADLDTIHTEIKPLMVIEDPLRGEPLEILPTTAKRILEVSLSSLVLDPGNTIVVDSSHESDIDAAGQFFGILSQRYANSGGVRMHIPPRDAPGLKKWFKAQLEMLNAAMKVREEKKYEEGPGGIDLNMSHADTGDIKDGQGVAMTMDAAMIERIKQQGVESLTPVIVTMTRLSSIWPLTGLSPQGAR